MPNAATGKADYKVGVIANGFHAKNKNAPASDGQGQTNRLMIKWQEWRDSNPQPPVLETGALPIELHS